MTTDQQDGFYDDLSEEARALDPRFVDGYRRWWRGSKLGALTPVMRELIGMAVNGSITTFNLQGMRHHLSCALAVGATPTQILEALELVSVVGVHTFNVSVPIVLDELHCEIDSAELTPEQQQVKENFVRRRGTWPESFTFLMKVAEEFMAGYSDYSSAPWEHEKGLEPKERELVLVAMNASTTHLFTGGIRFHARSAIGHGASREELLEALAITSLVSMQTFIEGSKAFLEFTSQSMLRAIE